MSCFWKEGGLLLLLDSSPQVFMRPDLRIKTLALQSVQGLGAPGHCFWPLCEVATRSLICRTKEIPLPFPASGKLSGSRSPSDWKVNLSSLFVSRKITAVLWSSIGNYFALRFYLFFYWIHFFTGLLHFFYWIIFNSLVKFLPDFLTDHLFFLPLFTPSFQLKSTLEFQRSSSGNFIKALLYISVLI